jgi:RNA polymerase sigma-70 factor (ECF subfamily)
MGPSATAAPPLVEPPDPNQASDDALVDRIRAGEADAALAILSERYGTRIQHFVRGLVRDRHVAQDVTQEVFEKVFARSELYRVGTNFKAWLFEVARNQALSALRLRRRAPKPMSSYGSADREPEELFESRTATPPGETAEEHELMTALQDAVAALPAHYREVFTLCVQQGRPYQEAAQALGIPTGTVAIRIMRARKRLYRMLQHHLGRIRRPPACFL